MSKQRKDGFQMANELSDFLNSAMPEQKAEFMTTITTDHRFLQQEAFNLFMSCIDQWSANYKSGFYDERNAYACKTSNDIREMLERET